MSLLLAVMLQAVQATPPERIDLTIKQSCEAPQEAPADIVVCGRKSKAQRYRLNEPLPEREADIRKAELELLPGVKAAVEAEGSEVGGQQSNRAMIRLKVKF